MPAREPDAAQVIEPELRSNERLLWAGRPVQGVRLHGEDWFLLPVYAAWSGFLATAAYVFASSGQLLFAVAVSLCVLPIALYMLIGRFYFDARRRISLSYGITSSRVVICRGGAFMTIKSLQLATLVDVTLLERRDGTGTIDFGPVPPWWVGGWWHQSRPEYAAFEGIANVRNVFDTLEAAQQRARHGI